MANSTNSINSTGPAPAHCWHPVGLGSIATDNRIEACCHCGLTYDPTKRVPPPGHGQFTPQRDLIKPKRPEGACSMAARDHAAAPAPARPLAAKKESQ